MSQVSEFGIDNCLHCDVPDRDYDLSDPDCFTCSDCPCYMCKYIHCCNGQCGIGEEKELSK